MYEYIPEKNVKRSRAVVFLIIIGAIALVTITSFIPDLPFFGVLQTLFLAIAGIGIFIFTRYVSRELIYRIEKRGVDEDSEYEEYDLTVTEVQGRSRITVCKISLRSISDVTVCSRNTQIAQKNRVRGEKRKLYNYCADMFTQKMCYIYATECGEDVTVVLSYDEKLCEYLKNGGLND